MRGGGVVEFSTSFCTPADARTHLNLIASAAAAVLFPLSFLSYSSLCLHNKKCYDLRSWRKEEEEEEGERRVSIATGRAI